MEDSILKSVKKTLGLSPEYTAFDAEINTHINATFTVLEQLGIGPSGGIFVDGEEATWSSASLPQNQLNLVRTYMYLAVKLKFDPPGTSFYLKAMQDQIAEFEWRLTVLRDEAIAAQEVV